MGVAYFLAARLSLALLTKPEGVAVFWPAAGVAAGVLIALGPRARWPVVAGTMAATIVANLFGDRNLRSAILFAACNAGEAVLAAWLIERVYGAGFRLGRLRNVLGLFAAAMVGTALSAIGGTAGIRLFHNADAPLFATWQQWFASDALGIITVAPLLIELAALPRDRLSRSEVIEGLLAVASLALVCALAVFERWELLATIGPVALLFAPLLWLAARCRPVFASTAGIHREPFDRLDDDVRHRLFRQSGSVDGRSCLRRASQHPLGDAERAGSGGAVRRDPRQARLAEIALQASETQRYLIETERLAALGGLVAGVSHEINTPVGTSLTVASSLAHRCTVFAEQIAVGEVRRSQLDEFADSCRDASNQLVANLQRAGELIQSFKQVAVDRSHADRRTFDLKVVTEQIVASVRPGLPKPRRDSIALEIPAQVTLYSYPGAYGQVLTNLIFNAFTHGFPDGRDGRVPIKARELGTDRVEITFSDDGIGIPGDVQRHVFDPFFTTNRAQGNTGLGLYIVHNLVTQHLGGTITLASAPGKGTTITMTLPLNAPGHAEPAVMAGRIGR